MTEKRFTFVRDDNNKSIGIFDNKYERKCLQWGQIARLLNELDSENKTLKQQILDKDLMIYSRDKIIEEIEKDLCR